MDNSFQILLEEAALPLPEDDVWQMPEYYGSWPQESSKKLEGVSEVNFERNWNVFGIGEPLLYPIRRAGQPEIHLAKLLREFFQLDGGTCRFFDLRGEIIIDGATNDGKTEKWTISETRGCSTPNNARTVHPYSNDFYLTIKDAGMVQSLRGLLANYPRCEIDLARIIGIGGEGTVLDDSSERL